eukprot:c17433_g1_i1.p1 GENE.c17433_g1_i1~~c17433_g1_i1.p1  ORF type:complete len:393 (+),score=117.20 c17433_g1_i1:12-1190(+)
MPRPGVELDAFIQPLPIQDLQISPATNLPQTRSACPKCNKSNKWFCPYCRIVMGDKNAVPQVQLPVSVDIIHHPGEKLTKSTSTHAVLLSPNVGFYDYPSIPQYNDNKTIILYPSEDAKSIDEVDFENIEKVLFIDCTWSQAHIIIAHENLCNIKRIKLNPVKTAFWRTQRLGGDHLATIEAVFYFFLQSHHKFSQDPYDHRYDNLLFFFFHLHEMFIESQKDKITEFMKTEEYQQRKEYYAKKESAINVKKIEKRAIKVSALSTKRFKSAVLENKAASASSSSSSSSSTLLLTFFASTNSSPDTIPGTYRSPTTHKIVIQLFFASESNGETTFQNFSKELKTRNIFSGSHSLGLGFLTLTNVIATSTEIIKAAKDGIKEPERKLVIDFVLK